MATGRYSQSGTFRRDAYDTVVTRFSGGHDDILESSTTSLHYDDGRPKFVVDGEKRVHLYYGNQLQYQLEKMSDLSTGDRVMEPAGKIIPENTKPLYKACAKALNHGLFRLHGDYDCANVHVRSLMSGHAFEALPQVEADRWFPYYFEPGSSPIKGKVNYMKILPTDDDPESRTVTSINVMSSHGDLAVKLLVKQTIYLGGEHEEEDVRVGMGPEAMEVGDESAVRKKSTKYVEYRYDTAVAGPGGVEDRHVRISSPFLNTWRGKGGGLNVGLAKLWNGHFLYWATSYQPGSGLQVSTLPLEEIPAVPFSMPQGMDCPWPPEECDDTALESIFEGAWVMRGDCLVQGVQVGMYPEGVLKRLRGGFFRGRYDEVFTHVPRISARIRKSVESIQRLGGKTFGLKESGRGTIECDIKGLARYLRLPEDVLMAFMTRYGQPDKYFRGTVNFLGRKKMEGIFEITEPLPVGPWMRGKVLDTGAGLLFVESNDKYYTVDTKDEVSWLSEYSGPGIEERHELELGECIASADAEENNVQNVL